MVPAASGKDGAVFDIVGRQGISHEDDMIGRHYRRPKLALDFLNEGRRLRLERTLHQRLRVMRVGECLAMKACAGIHAAFFPFPSFDVWYPVGKRRCIEPAQRWGWEKTTRLQVPLMAVIGGELSAIRALSPAQAAMRKEKLGQYHSVPARIFLLVETLRGSLIQWIPRTTSVASLDPTRRDQMSEVVIEVKWFGR